MNTKNGSRAIAAAAAVTGALLLAGPAQALETIYADYQPTYVGGSASGTVRLSGSDVDKGGGGGIFAFERGASTSGVPPLVSNAAGNFLAICLELSETLVDPATYHFNALENAPVNGSDAPTMSATGRMGSRADDLRYFLGNALPNFAGQVQDLANPLTPAQAALAVQLVVWEIANENYGDGTGGTFDYSLIDGFLTIDSPPTDAAAFLQASVWLNDLNNGAVGWTPLNNVFALINPQVPGQDFVVQVVPIPAAAWLLGSGLLGLFGISRRRKVVAA